eukprot:s7029_g3.t1
MFASWSGRLEVARLLLEAGAHKDCRRDDGMTALMLASSTGRLRVAHLLLEAGADKDCGRQDGMTAQMLASSNEHVKVASLLREAGIRDNGGCQHHGQRNSDSSDQPTGQRVSCLECLDVIAAMACFGRRRTRLSPLG